MPQYFYLDKANLDKQFELIDNSLYQMLDLAYLHEDMIVIIESLMSEWCKERDPVQFESIRQHYEYEADMGYWWKESFHQLSVDDKENFILRYRATIACCLHSNTYDEDDIKRNIDAAM
jgi:hypothetical protein